MPQRQLCPAFRRSVCFGRARVPAPRRRPAQAPHPVSGQRNAADRGGHGPRGLRRERVDPVPPPVAVPRTRARLVRADRAGRMGARRARAPALPDDGRSRPRATRSPAASCSCGTPTSRSRSARPTEPMDFFYRNGEGDEVIFVHEGSGTLETIFGDLPVQGRRLRRRPARDDLPLRPRGPAAAPRLRVTGPDRDSPPLPERVRAAARARARTTTATSTRRPSCTRIATAGSTW